MKQKITAVRTILLRGFACILSTVFGISFLLNGSAFFASAAELGDVDGDGSVTIQDACWILETYAKISAGIPTEVSSDLKVTADVDEDGVISVQDAVMVLQYYAKQAAGITVSWEILRMSAAEQLAWDRSQKVLELVNENRAENGLAELSFNKELYQAASIRAEELATSFSHSRPNGKSAFSVLDDLEIFYMCAGENIAAGFNTPKTAITAWMHSPGHRANILGTDYTSAAVGVYVSSDETCYWCLMLIGD